MSKSTFPLLLLGAVMPRSSVQAQSNLASLSGQYVLYLTGQEQLPSGASGFEAMAGSFTADGQGHITSGVLDKNSSTGLVQVSKLTGVYTLDATAGKGTISLQLPTGPLNFTFYSQLPLPASNVNYKSIDAAIVAGGGTLLNGTGRLSNSEATETMLSPVTFSLDGEAASGAGTVSGISYLNLVNGSTQVSGQAIFVENGATSNYSSLTGTATAVDAVTGRFTISLAGLGKGAANYAVYRGGFSTGSTVFLSLDPSSSAPLLVGINGSSLPSYVIQYYGSEIF